MNYRHAFHAGNFADCMKHALLVWLLRALAAKEKPFRVLDTHAGIGRYDLSAASEAERTGEWRRGIGRLLDIEDGPLADYVALARAAGAPATYPGSPALVAALMRPQDQLRLFEIHPTDHKILASYLGETPGVEVKMSDGFASLKSQLPPPTRRGVVLIDPSYEIKHDYARVQAMVADALVRFATGTYADNTTADLTASVTWSSSDGGSRIAIACITANIVAFCVRNGVPPLTSSYSITPMAHTSARASTSRAPKKASGGM
jgi:23S rRNA (adenine2030-N6)-methyltransferase